MMMDCMWGVREKEIASRPAMFRTFTSLLSYSDGKRVLWHRKSRERRPRGVDPGRSHMNPALQP